MLKTIFNEKGVSLKLVDECVSVSNNEKSVILIKRSDHTQKEKNRIFHQGRDWARNRTSVCEEEGCCGNRS